MRWTATDAKFAGRITVSLPPDWASKARSIYVARRPLECGTCQQPIAAGEEFVQGQRGYPGCARCYPWMDPNWNVVTTAEA